MHYYQQQTNKQSNKHHGWQGYQQESKEHKEQGIPTLYQGGALSIEGCSSQPFWAEHSVFTVPTEKYERECQPPGPLVGLSFSIYCCKEMQYYLPSMEYNPHNTFRFAPNTAFLYKQSHVIHRVVGTWYKFLVTGSKIRANEGTQPFVETILVQTCRALISS